MFGRAKPALSSIVVLTLAVLGSGAAAPLERWEDEGFGFLEGGAYIFRNLKVPRLPVGTWYVTFLIEGAPPGFNFPAVITFHRDGTFEAVDAGDFGALPELPFNQTSQQGVWRWLGNKRYLASGMIFSFKGDMGLDGQLDNISRTHIWMEFGTNRDEFTAFVTQDFWFCPDTFLCPDPLTTPPHLTLPPEGPGFFFVARRLRAQ